MKKISLLDLIQGNSISDVLILITANDVHFLGLEWFLGELKNIPAEQKKQAYAGLLHEYLLDLRSNRFNGEESMFYADVFHHLPLFLSRNFEDFSDDFFWDWIRNEASTRYLLQHFIKHLEIVACQK